MTITGTGFPLGNIIGLTVNIGSNTASVISSSDNGTSITIDIPIDTSYDNSGSYSSA